jgi:hypothetical protein
MRRWGGLALAGAGMALAVGAAAPAQARNYLLLRANAEAWTLIDPSTIENVPGGVLRRTWVVTVQRNILNQAPAQPGYVRTLTEYDCGSEQIRWRRLSAFSRTGAALVSEENKFPSWTEAKAKPTSLAELRAVCGRPLGQSAISADSIAAAVIARMQTWDAPLAPAPGLDEQLRPATPKRAPPPKRR